MLNSSAEGKLKKSELYWPEVGSREHGPFTTTLVECQVFADYTIRTMQLEVKLLRVDFLWAKGRARARERISYVASYMERDLMDEGWG